MGQCGGNWILQERLEDSRVLKRLLPANAPLSTMRIVTRSTLSLNELVERAGSGASAPKDENKEPDFDPVAASAIEPVVAVFRAGRKNAKTDHRAIFFDIDMQSKRIKKGGLNSHWYQTTLASALDAEKDGVFSSAGVFTQPGRFAERQAGIDRHPDEDADGGEDLQLVGREMPMLNESLDMVRRAHAALCADVPLCGWDVALVDCAETGKPKPVLIEVNLSCNFFLGSYDAGEFYEFCESRFAELDRENQAQRMAGTAS